MFMFFIHWSMVFIHGFQHFLYVCRPSLSGVSGFPFLSNIFSTVSIGTCASFVSIYLSIYAPTFVFIFLPIYLSICIYLYLSLSISDTYYIVGSSFLSHKPKAKSQKANKPNAKCEVKRMLKARSQKPKSPRTKSQKRQSQKLISLAGRPWTRTGTQITGRGLTEPNTNRTVKKPNRS